MSPAPAAGQVPTSVSLFDLNADAPVLQGLSLVSHPPGEALAQALPTSSPGIREDLGWLLRSPGIREDLGWTLRSMTGVFGVYCHSRNTFLSVFPRLGTLVDIFFCWIKFTLNSFHLWVISSTGLRIVSKQVSCHCSCLGHRNATACRNSSKFLYFFSKFLEIV